MKKNYYIAYGSNMDFSQMRRRCPDAELVGAGIVKDYELLFKGSGSGSYATIEEKARDKVPVPVLEHVPGRRNGHSLCGMSRRCAKNPCSRRRRSRASKRRSRRKGRRKASMTRSEDRVRNDLLQGTDRLTSF